MSKKSKDYSKYFDFSNAKVISEDEHSKRIRINGREINIISEPNHRAEKQRGSRTSSSIMKRRFLQSCSSWVQASII